MAENTSYSFADICRLNPRALDQLFERGTLPDVEALVGCAFRGYNTPAMTAALGIRKFIKGFFRENGLIEGYNRKVKQNCFDEPWLPTSARRFGFYHVSLWPVEQPRSLLLDYGRSTRNPALEPARVLRDYVVQIYPDNPALLLGKAYVSIMGAEMLVSRFVLEVAAFE